MTPEASWGLAGPRSIVHGMAFKRSPKDASGKPRASARVGYVLVGLAIAVVAVGDVFPHGAQWPIAGIFLWAGVTLIARSRGWRVKRPALAVSGPIAPRVRPLKPGETYQDAVKLALVPNVPLAEV